MVQLYGYNRCNWMQSSVARNMVYMAATGFLLMLYLSQVFAQTTPAEDEEYSTTLTTLTCVAGTTECPTEQTSEGSELPVTEEISTVSLPSPTIRTTSVTPSLENVTTSASTSTKKKGSSTTTTLPPPTSLPETLKVPEKQLTAYTHSGTCACDLTSFSCDINCCCDPDCMAHERVSFSHCESNGYPAYDNRYCNVAKLIFLNNSQHILQQTQNGAFCIVRSNLAGSVIYPIHPIFVTQQEFSKHWERSHSPVWPDFSQPQLLSVDKPRPYVAGTRMWVLHSNQIRTLDLPSSGITNACTAKKSLQYLVPWSSQCLQKTPTTKEECNSVGSHLYYQISTIIRSPLLVNHTELLSGKVGTCPANICVATKVFVCSKPVLQDKHFTSCKNVSNPKILFGFKSGVCYGAVRSLKLVFFHNGTEGLDHIEAFMELSNISSTEGFVMKPLHQKLAVEFKWAITNTTLKELLKHNTIPNAQNSTSKVTQIPFARSGNPGYIVGKPVLVGFWVKQKLNRSDSQETSKENDSSSTKQDMIQLSHDPLSLPGSRFDGVCDWSEAKRQIVTFGEDLHTSCGVSISPSNISSQSSCSSLRSRMLQLLLGDISDALHNTSFQSDWGRVVAGYGNANVSRHQDWVPLLLDNQAPFSLQGSISKMKLETSVQEDAVESANKHPLQICENVPLGILIRIMHASVGPTLNAQSKILGASLRFSPVQDVGLICPSAVCFEKRDSLSLRVVSSVKFVDISSPAVTRFAEPPAIHIRLPPDFFYPFMAAEDSYSKAMQNFPSFILVLLITILAIL